MITNKKNNDVRKSIRVISAIAIKDIVDGIKNKNTLSGIFVVIFLVVLYKWLPNLYNPGLTKVVVFDAGDSRLITELENSPKFRVRRTNSLQEFQNMMDDGDEGELGLLIPAGFDQLLQGYGRSQINAYLLWSSRSDAEELKLDFERRIEGLLDQPVSINIEGTIYPQSDSMGSIRMVSLSLVIALFFIGSMTVPYMMFEEKQTRTLDTLLISPASPAEVVWGKSVAGFFYCAMTAVILFVVYRYFVIDWGLALFTAFCVILISVGIGLALGTFLNNKQQLSTWILILGQPLLIPVFLSMIDPILPESARNILPWMPMVAQMLLFRYSFSAGASSLQVWTALGIVLVSMVFVFGLLIWKVRRFDRE